MLSIGSAAFTADKELLSTFSALRANATVIEVNPNFASLTAAAHFSVRGSSGLLLPEIVKTAWDVRITARA
jgi:hypothetical protein